MPNHPAGGLSTWRQRPGCVPLALLLGLLWGWLMVACSDAWRFNPNYDYGWLVPPLAAWFAWTRLQAWAAGRPPAGDAPAPAWTGWALAAALVAVIPVELLRQELHDSRTAIWLAVIVVYAATAALLLALGGPGLLRAMLFPLLFFLTAVPWLKSIENHLVIGLAGAVAQVTIEFLHWAGVDARADGNIIQLSETTVGISEACSGIRSLQAAVMFGLAAGEFMRLRTGGRAALLGGAVLWALVTNLIRTFWLSWTGEHGGEAAMERAHDFIGNVMMWLLPAGIFAVAFAVRAVVRWAAWDEAAEPAAEAADPGPPKPPAPPPDAGAALAWRRLPRLGPALAVLALGLAGWQAYFLVLERQRPGVQAPQFATRAGPGTPNEALEMDPLVWKALEADQGWLLSHGGLPRGAAYGYHFFWRPSVRNRLTAGHRPDVCMKGGGWQLAGEVARTNVVLGGQTVPFYVFPFERRGARALQLWALLRNGRPVELDIVATPLGIETAARWSLFAGKNRSALEVLSTVLVDDRRPPTVEQGVAALQTMFEPAGAGGGPSAGLEQRSTNPGGRG
jgi:exosortase